MSGKSGENPLQKQIVSASQALAAVAALNGMAQKQLSVDILGSMTSTPQQAEMLDNVVAVAGVITLVSLFQDE